MYSKYILTRIVQKVCKYKMIKYDRYILWEGNYTGKKIKKNVKP